MEKLKMSTRNLTNENYEKLVELFPNVVTEIIDDEGNIVRAIDKDVLMQEINTHVVDESQERYQFTWPDKNKTIIASNSLTTKTLRPCRDESINFDRTKNIYIEGDNLEVLKVLKETYLGRIKLAYLDPPYNTGKDLLYLNTYEINEKEYFTMSGDKDVEGNILKINSDSDGRYHTNWLNMMYSRIKLSRNLLSDDGCMVLAIDHNELQNLIKICDEIFGENNRVGIITVVHKPEGRNQEKYFASSNEFALFYAKNKSCFDLEPVIFNQELKDSFNLRDSKGPYKLVSYIAKNHGRAGYDKNLRVNNPKKFYSIFVNPKNEEVSLDYKEGYYEALPITKTQERTWKHIISTFKDKLREREIVGKIENGKAVIYEKYRPDKGQLIKTHWTDKRYNAMVHGTKHLDKIMGSKTFDFPKSIYLLEDIIRMTTDKESIIIDIFSGSATTAEAVINVNNKFLSNRKFILIQVNQENDDSSPALESGFSNIPQIGKERIRRAGKKILEENKDKEGIEKLDVGFRVLKLDSSNMKDIYYTPQDTQQSMLEDLTDNIKEDRSELDLLFQVMLDLGVELSSTITEIDISGKKVFSVSDKYLLATFDKDIDEKTITEIAKRKPVFFVMRDASLTSDSVATNFEQIFNTYSPDTTRKVI